MSVKGAKGLVISAVTLTMIISLFNMLLTKHLIQIPLNSFLL